MSVIRRFFAAVVLLAIVVGAPLALWFFGRHYLPDHVPSWTEVKAFFTERDTGQLFIGALVLIGIIAWLVFTLSVVIEAAAMLAGRRGQWRIPGFRIPQRAAMALLTTLFTATITVGTAVPASAAAPAPLASAVQPYHLGASPAPAATSAARAVTAPVTAPRPAASSAAAGPTVTVGRYDTWWRLAENHLGDGFRLHEIVALNAGIEQPDGDVVRDAETPVRPGWVLRLPADAVVKTAPAAGAASAVPAAPGGDVRVQARPGDSVSSITEQETGDGDLWPAVAKASGMSDPDQLAVGQTVVIPGALISHHDPRTAGERTMRVQPGDTLSEIASRVYGNPGLDGWLAQVNHIADPNQIIAGATLLIPVQPGAVPATSAPAPATSAAQQAAQQKAAAEKAASEKAAAEKAEQKAAAEKAAAEKAAAEKTASEQAAEAAAAQAKIVATKEADANPGTVPVGPASPATTTPAVTAPATPASPPEPAPAAPTGSAAVTSTAAPSGRHADTASAESSSTVVPVLAVGGGAVVLTGLAFAALLAARRRQSRWRRPGRAIASTPPELVSVERTLLTKGSEHVADVTWLDDALRTLAQELARTPGSRIPDVVAAKLTDEDLQLVLGAAGGDGAGAVGGRRLRVAVDVAPLGRVADFGPRPQFRAAAGAGVGGLHRRRRALSDRPGDGRLDLADGRPGAVPVADAVHGGRARAQRVVGRVAGQPGRGRRRAGGRESRPAGVRPGPDPGAARAEHPARLGRAR